ncbi:D-aminopeptidase DppA [Streptomyces spinoverrucosus]|uniref:D-aminopeptidase DppA n=1 Tax=Streptomyces spinoverrucosus TaxID=284043 RepID=A0A4Y3VW63_9ACTN|nr:M55 family metallopeptidase [Streptomyces spinoverrucosus]GEC10488.1 D-aminopeptidase DppA [Streptomyces spinoverrucosus]GHB67666.1 D-aminopeptidase DppA [Streptomyces spinoverrucosus]
MQVYISADMEGVTGLVAAQDVQAGGQDYQHGRAMMTEDVNAAVRGALAAGATRVLVNDAHSTMRNLLVDQLYPEAELVRGKPKRMGMLEDLDPEFDAVLCVGYHSRAGALGVLSHSYMGHEIEDMWLDDRPMGEIGFAHATATALGVPVVMLSGDDVACAEMTAWDAEVVTVPVKYARDRFSARLRPAAEARKAIEEAAAEGVRRAAFQPRPSPDESPATLAVRWQSASVAAQLEAIPGVTLRDSRTVQVTGPVPQLFRLFGIFMRVASSVTDQQPYC